jgi:uncharacterized membrane protein YbhN (UPF0104 family)
VLIKLSIVAGAFYFIYYKLTTNGQLSLSDFVGFLSKNSVFSIKNIIFLLFLSVFNWFFEILKWKRLVGFVESITLKNAIEQSLGSLTASLFTPNRIGEYGAKAMYFKPSLRKRIVLINLLSNILQMSVTVLLGIIGLFFFLQKHELSINLSKGILFLLFGLLGISLIIYLFVKSKLSIKGFLIEKVKDFLINYPKQNLIQAFIFSLLRYFIFSFQFYYLLVLFQIDLDYFNAMVLVTSMYLIASILPSIFIFDVVIKGSVAVYIFSLAGINELTILSVVMIMWLFNFVLPSIIGSYFVLNYDLPNKERLV